MITAIVVNYHAANSALNSVSSLLSKAGENELDIHVVDNSEDETEAHFLRSRLAGDCTVVINPENIGFGAACNQVFEQTGGEWVFLLNPDAYLEPGALETLRTFMEDHPEAGAAGPLIYWDEGKRFLLPPSIYPSPWRDFLTFPDGCVRSRLAWLKSLWWRRRSIRVWKAGRPVIQENLSGGHVLLRRSAVEKAGGLFDPRFFLYYEDTDLFLRLRRAGFGLYVVPDAKVIHQFGGCARGKLQWKREKMAESRALFMKKHYSGHPALKLAERKGAESLCKSWKPRIYDLGVLTEPPVLSVPDKWRSSWLLEWSPDPCLYPSAGCFGTGKEARFPDEAWSILPPGKQYLRLGPARGFWVLPRVRQWEKR